MIFHMLPPKEKEKEIAMYKRFWVLHINAILPYNTLSRLWLEELCSHLCFPFCEYWYDQTHIHIGGSKNERWGRLLLSPQSWFPWPSISNAPTFESFEFWSMSRNTWVCRRATVREVWLTLAEDTFSESVFRRCWEAFTWWTSSICW